MQLQCDNLALDTRTLDNNNDTELFYFPLFSSVEFSCAGEQTHASRLSSNRKQRLCSIQAIETKSDSSSGGGKEVRLAAGQNRRWLKGADRLQERKCCSPLVTEKLKAALRAASVASDLLSSFISQVSWGTISIFGGQEASEQTRACERSERCVCVCVCV